jgi:GTP:adenosylcobinamide-phosphate guanylyltransferase
MDAIVTAGGIPKPGEPLYSYTLGASKALLDIAGKPMIRWLLEALESAETIERVVVIGLAPESVQTTSKVAAFLPNQGSMIENIRAGVRKIVELNPDTRHVLLVSSDIPAITGKIVDWFVRASQQSDQDIYYSVVPRRVMEKRFPGSKRSYTRLSDIEVCGGDMHIIRAELAFSTDRIWDDLIGARKNVFKQASIIGFDTLLLLLIGILTLEDAVRRVTKRLKLTGQPVKSPYAELGMDVDKPAQLEMLRADLGHRSGQK